MDEYITIDEYPYLAGQGDYKSGLSGFIEASLRKTSIPYLAWLALAGLIALMVYVSTKNMGLSSLRLNLLVYYLVISAHFIFRVKTSGGIVILSPDMLFLMLYTMFHLGYISLYDLGVLPHLPGIFVYDSSVPQSIFAINLGLIAYLFGYEMFGTQRRSDIAISSLRIPNHSWGMLGQVLMVTALVMHLTGLAALGIGTLQRYGYTAVQGSGQHLSATMDTVFKQSIYLMVLGLSIYITYSALRYRKLFHSKLALVITIIFFALVIMEGDRGPLALFIMPLLLVRHYFVKLIRIRYVVIMFIGVLMLFGAIKVVRSVAFNPAQMVAEYEHHRASGLSAWYDPVVEMGASFLALNITTHEVPLQEPYWKGDSWKNALVHMVPFLQGYAFRQGWVTWEPSNWITVTYFGTGRSGRAFTVTAEGYLNFGFLGVIVELAFVGILMRWLVSQFCKRPSAVRAFIMLAALAPTILIARNHLNVVTLRYTQVLFVAMLLKLFFSESDVAHIDEETPGWDYIEEYQ